MKQTIKDAGLPTADLVERKDVEERAQAKARLAEAERLKRRSRDDDGARAQVLCASPPPRPPRPSQPRATTGAAAMRREEQAQHGVRVVHNVSGVEGLSTSRVLHFCRIKTSRRGLRRHRGVQPEIFDMAFQKSGARRQTDWRLMKNPSKKQDAEGNWYGRAASNVRSFRHYAWFDWAAIGFARDHLWAGLALPDEIKYNQYIPCQRRRHSKHALAPL